VGFETNENFHKISLERLHQKMTDMNLPKGKSKKEEWEKWLEPQECEV
jgi:hypothetical protein